MSMGTGRGKRGIEMAGRPRSLGKSRLCRRNLLKGGRKDRKERAEHGAEGAMTDGSKTDGGGKAERERRLAEALRENLRKRKTQARGRRAGEADDRQGLAASVATDTQKPESGA